VESLRIVLLCTAAAVLYGLVQDQVTARVCVEYFTIGHPKIVDSTDPTVLGLAWGVAATWWFGASLGLALALCARLGSRPPLSWRELVRPVAWLLVGIGVAALAAGLVGWRLASAGQVRLVAPLSDSVPRDRHVAFLADLWAHLAAYGAGLVGAIALCVLTARRRARLRRA
jgi:hypothetical protein